MDRTETPQPDDPASDPSAKPKKKARRIDRKRRWWLPRFRLINLIWLSLIAAILMSWRRDHEQLVDANEKLLAGRMVVGKSWSIKQILGAPDTPLPGDQSTAWASQTQDGSREWLIVEFPNSVDVKQIVVYESFNPGAVDRICTVSFRGDETEIWKGTDPTPTTAAIGKSAFVIKPSVQSRRFKIFLNSPAVPGWNEIDAVALYGKDGSVQWATNAWASSAYGDNQDLPGWFWP